MLVKHSNFSLNFWNFLFLFSKSNSYFIYLLHNSHKIIFKLKYGLYHYFFWLKVGCKNYFSKKWFSVFFFLDFVFSGLIAFKTYNYILTTLKYKFLPTKRSVFTISKGPMVRKKQSREQFTFKQMFITVKKIIHFFDKSDIKLGIAAQKSRSIELIKDNQLRFLYKTFVNKRSLNSLFFFWNSNAYLFLFFIKNISFLNLFIETNLFFLKKIYFFIGFNDIKLFRI